MARKYAVIYARVSTEMQRSNGSLCTQVHLCTEYAIKNGYTVVEDHYIDSKQYNNIHYVEQDHPNAIPVYIDAWSAYYYADRPGLNELFNYVEHNKVDAVISLYLDRMARDRDTLKEIEDRLHEYGTSFEYVGYEDDKEFHNDQVDIYIEYRDYFERMYVKRLLAPLP